MSYHEDTLWVQTFIWKFWGPYLSNHYSLLWNPKTILFVYTIWSAYNVGIHVSIFLKCVSLVWKFASSLFSCGAQLLYFLEERGITSHQLFLSLPQFFFSCFKLPVKVIIYFSAHFPLISQNFVLFMLKYLIINICIIT